MAQDPAPHHNHRALIALALLLAFLLVVAFWIRATQPPASSNVLGASVQTTAAVPGCIIGVTAHPEKRVPPVNNWGTTLSLTIVDSSAQTLGSFTANSGNNGQAIVDLCALGMLPLPGSYTFYIRGMSHLRQVFHGIPAFNGPQTYIDFSAGGTQTLIAGEMSNVFDNKINALDLSAQFASFNSANIKTDLNRDGEVNSLDLSNTIFNFYRRGN